MHYEVIEIATGARMSHRAGLKGEIMGTTLFDSALAAGKWMDANRLSIHTHKVQEATS